MQTFPCPFCGQRPETEFHFAGDLGNLRPEGFLEVSPETWSSYLFAHNNPRGESKEIWKHLTCMEVFTMNRDTLSHIVNSSTALLPEGEA
ncbi:sarcosine oxidase subunit delta [Rhizobium sp. LjRoot254]|uniref:sarcosine oxidase subunit delta n=1 Tax=Rhizobium sp. LjRoot254 TaxID=3342297 RepID=UPI003ED160C4